VTQCLGITLERRKIGQRAETESAEELKRCCVANWTTGCLQTPSLFNESTFKEHAKGVVSINATNLFDATLGDRLAVGDDGECL